MCLGNSEWLKKYLILNSDLRFQKYKEYLDIYFGNTFDPFQLYPIICRKVIFFRTLVLLYLNTKNSVTLGNSETP